MEYRDFSSMPPEEERQFVTFERRTVTSAKKAWQLAYIAAAAFGVLVLVTVMSFDPPKNQHAEDLENSLSAEEDLDNDTPDKPEPKKTEPAPAPEGSEGGDGAGGAEGGDGAGGAEGGEAGGAEGGSESGAAPAAAPAGGSEAAAEAPPPPKGATKAPPTALVGDKK